MKLALTHKQKQILFFIRNFIETKGYPPSARDIAEGMGFSKQHAFMSVNTLVAKGHIKKDSTQSPNTIIPI